MKVSFIRLLTGEQIIQKREHVRAVDDFLFSLEFNNTSYDCKCLNISSKGIAFSCEYKDLKISDNVIIFFEDYIFGVDITAQAEIIKKNDDYIVAKFNNLSEYDENKIVKRIFKILAKK